MATSTDARLVLGHLRPLHNLHPFSIGGTPMRLTGNFLLKFCNVTILICFVFGALSAHAQTHDIDRSWTTVGSAGTVDKNDVSKVFFDHSIVQMGRVVVGPVTRRRALVSHNVQSAVIRYNV